MQASLNLKPCEVPSEAQTLAEVLHAVEEGLLPPGHVITRILLDGEELPEEAEAESLTRPASEIRQIEFFSARTLDLAAENLEAATELLPQLVEQVRASAQQLRRGEYDTGLTLYAECIEIIDWYVNVVAACDILLSRNGLETSYETGGDTSADELSPGDAESLDLGGSELSTFASVSNLRERLLELEDAQAAEDLGRLADHLEHEIQPIAALWAREAPQLLARIRHESGEA